MCIIALVESIASIAPESSRKSCFLQCSYPCCHTLRVIVLHAGEAWVVLFTLTSGSVRSPALSIKAELSVPQSETLVGSLEPILVHNHGEAGAVATGAWEWEEAPQGAVLTLALGSNVLTAARQRECRDRSLAGRLNGG